MLLLEIVHEADWSAAERKWIAHYRSLGPLENRTVGGQGVSGALRTVEWKRKIVENRRASGKAAEGHKRGAERQRGRKMSAETRAKMSASATGRIASPETLAKMSVAQKGRKLSPERVAKCGVWRGKRQSKEHCEKKRVSMEVHTEQQSADQIARWNDPEYRARVTASMIASRARRRPIETQHKGEL
jgi:hypothetical protein